MIWIYRPSATEMDNRPSAIEVDEIENICLYMSQKSKIWSILVSLGLLFISVALGLSIHFIDTSSIWGQCETKVAKKGYNLSLTCHRFGLLRFA